MDQLLGIFKKRDKDKLSPQLTELQTQIRHLRDVDIQRVLHLPLVCNKNGQISQEEPFNRSFFRLEEALYNVLTRLNMVEVKAGSNDAWTRDELVAVVGSLLDQLKEKKESDERAAVAQTGATVGGLARSNSTSAASPGAPPAPVTLQRQQSTFDTELANVDAELNQLQRQLRSVVTGTRLIFDVTVDDRAVDELPALPANTIYYSTVANLNRIRLRLDSIPVPRNMNEQVMAKILDRLARVTEISTGLEAERKRQFALFEEQKLADQLERLDIQEVEERSRRAAAAAVEEQRQRQQVIAEEARAREREHAAKAAFDVAQAAEQRRKGAAEEASQQRLFADRQQQQPSIPPIIPPLQIPLLRTLQIPRPVPAPPTTTARVLTPDMFEKGEFIASGGFGDVFKGKYQGHTPVAIKFLRVANGPGPGEEDKRREFIREVKEWAGVLNHENVMPLIGWCPQPLCMLTDLMEGGTSIEYLRNKNWEPQEAIVKLLYDVAKGMTHLHSLNIVHSDLKPQNILVDSSGKAKVSDFGMSKMREHSTAAAHSQFRGGTLVFIAPEIFRDAKRSFKSDVYAFGITAWMLLSEGASPFTGIGNIVQFAIRIQTDPHFRPLRPMTCLENDSMWSLIQACWMFDPTPRPSFRNIADQLEPILRRLLSPTPPEAAEMPSSPSTPLETPWGMWTKTRPSFSNFSTTNIQVTR